MTLNIAVFLGSRDSNNKKCLMLINNFSEWFSSENFNLIFGGTETGLMGKLAKNVLQNNCKVTSIFTKNLYKKSKNLKYFSELIIAEDLSSRSSIIFERADLFVALPGGIGTMYEVLEVINKNMLKEINKKIFLINDSSFWNPFKDLLNHLIENNLLNEKDLNKNLKICRLKELQLELRKINVKNNS